MATENDNSFIARIGNGFLALIGAVTPADFSAKFTEAWQSLVGDVKTLKESKSAAYDDKAILSRLDALEKFQKESPTKETIEGWAKAAGSHEASTAVAAVGVSAIQAPAAPAATATASTSDQLKAQGKYTEAYAALPADHQDRKDFASAERYAAYMAAMHGNKIAIFKKD